MFFTVGHQRFTGAKLPLPPGGDDSDAGLEGIGTEFKTNLVIAFACRPVGDGIRAGVIGNFNQAFGDQRTGNGGAQQVFTLVNGVGPEHRKNKVLDKLFPQVFDENLPDPQGFRFFPGRLHLFPLPDVGRKSHDLTIMGLL